VKLPRVPTETPPGPGDAHIDVVLRPSGDALDVYLVQAKHWGVVDGMHIRDVRLKWFRPSFWWYALQVTAELAASVIRDVGLPGHSWIAKLRPTPGSLTAFAVFLAGRHHSASREEWRSHLAGESGHQLSRRDQMNAARGFVWAAVRYRIEDATELVWQPVDAVLRSRTLSNIFIAGPVIVMLVAIVRHDGRYGLVSDIQDPVALGVFLYGVIRTGRWWRAVKPPEPKARRVKE
jgi:hypothetical protein